MLNQLLPALRRPRLAEQQGFTLLEILVVLTIMGFLIAMVAPRLTGLTSSAGGTVCDNNKGRSRDYVAAFYEKFNRYPNRLTNLVIADGTNADPLSNSYQIPPVDDQDVDTGPEVIKYEMASAFRHMIHRLSAAEAKELNDLGIFELVNLNEYTGLKKDTAGTGYESADGRDQNGDNRLGNWVDIAAIATPAPLREVVKVQEGLGVAMSGCGAATAASNAFTFTQAERNWGMDETFGRIILTIGPDSELVSSGMISKAATAPSGLRYSDLYTFDEYAVILPRLQATSDRLRATGATFATAWGSAAIGDLTKATEVIYPKGTGPTASGYNLSTNTSNYSLRTVDLTAPQEPWAFSKQRDQNGDQYAYDITVAPAANQLN